MKQMRRISKKSLFSLFISFCFVFIQIFSVSQAEALQDCHRVSLTYKDTKQENGSVIRLWTAVTCSDAVNEELADLTASYLTSMGQDLPKAGNSSTKNSRLDIQIRYSRTGLTWMSFLVSAKKLYHQQLTEQAFTTRTYDMTTGERITLYDVFEYDSEGWDILADEVRKQLASYFPDEPADEAVLDKFCSRGALEEADFTFQGYSLVLHYPAEILYPEHHTLLDVTLMYPSVRPFMTEQGITETDNLKYYQCCALTFDDGPSRTNTTKVLNSLLETGSRATFFVIGNRIDSYMDQVQREHDEGHAIGAHNWHHGNVSKSSASSLRSMRTKYDNALIKAIGIPSRYDRVPYGLYPKMIKAKVGWPYIQWSIDTYDWRGRSVTNVVNAVKKQICDGDIILCHDIKDNTPESTRQIATWLAENGYMLLTIDELFAREGITLEGNNVYFRCTNGETNIKKK